MVNRSFVSGLAFAVMAGWSAMGQADTLIARAGLKVETGVAGRQVLFRDKTSLTLGADARLTVARADYDDNSGGGNVALTVAKGAFRYVTGNANGSHTITTPLSTVGVRGTVVEGYVEPGAEAFVLLEGAIEVCTKRRGKCQTLANIGSYVVVKADGSISQPQPVSIAMAGGLLNGNPSVDLVQQYQSGHLDFGRDPQVRFRDINDSIGGRAGFSTGSTGLPP